MSIHEALRPQLREEYTEYYAVNNSDSAMNSRTFLISELLKFSSELLKKQKRVRILDLGAGIQILESELLDTVAFNEIKNRIDIITLDLADVDHSQLLSPEFLHIQGSGDNLPFADSLFHIVISSSAIDFMPREVFNEVNRVLAPQGKLLATFHHPSLISGAELMLPIVLQKLRAVDKKLEHGRQSRKRAVNQEKRNYLAIQLRDLQFMLGVLPKIIFRSVEEIEAVLIQHSFAVCTAFEQEVANHQNGWFFAEAVKE
jgi:SAM-dependent methyltransferase